MNTIYKSKWSESTQTWVACSELVRGKTKNNCTKFVAAILLALASINSYAACDLTEDSPPSINATSKDSCQLTAPAYTNISASGATLQGNSINAQGKANGINKTITLIKSKLTANEVTTQNSSSNAQAQALSINNSTATVKSLTAINKGSTATVIETKNNANLTVENNLVIKDLVVKQTGASYNINNNNSTITVNGTIDITNQETPTSEETFGGVSSINNNGGKITADRISIKQKSKNSAIVQSNDDESDLDTSIEIRHDLDITATNQNASNPVIEISAGKIEVGNKTQITTNYNSRQLADDASAISIKDGQYIANGDVNITIKDDENNNSNKANGILLGDNATFINGGTAQVNGGDNTVIATNISNINSSKAKATVNNIGTIKSKDDGSVDSIVHNSKGTLMINNEGTGTIEGMISNKTQGIIQLENNGNILHGIKNTSGIININNNQASSKINGSITNNGGSININNNQVSSQIDASIKNDGDNAQVNINNTGTLSGDINNTKGKISIENTENGTIHSNINNNGDITLTNKGTVRSTTPVTITNQDQGNITIENTGTVSGDITNTGNGKITLNNQNTISGNIINTANDDANKPTVHIDITNTKDLTSQILNKGTGIIKITNTGTVLGDITNTGGRATDTDGNISKTHNNIEITNVGQLNNIINQGEGDIHLTNDGSNATVVGKMIKNTGTGNIKIDNQQKATLTHTFLNQSTNPDSFIEINNSGTINGDFENVGEGGKIFLQNYGTVTNHITNDTDLPNSYTSIMNYGELNSTIDINKGGFILDNQPGATSKINLTNKANLFPSVMNSGTLTGTIVNESGLFTFHNGGIFTGTTQNKSQGSLNLNNTGTWINNGNSTLSKLENTGTIEFPNISETDANDKNNYHTITVKGDYTGGGKGKIIVNTFWNDNGESYSDRIDIEGNVSGTPTTVSTHNGIYGDVSQKEISRHSATVIHVNGTTTDEAFWGDANTPNAGKAELKKIDSDTYGTGTNYAWVLTATPKPDPVPPTPTEPIQPDPADPAKPAPTEPVKPISPKPQKEVPIYAEPVSGYVQMPTVDMELGFTTIGTLHERRGENQTYNIHGANNTALGDSQQQTWGRVLAKHLDKDGKKRLDTAGNQSVLQIGHDFILDENDKTGARRHIGGYVSYGHNENDFRDQYRAENGYIVDDHYTGKGRTDAVSIGGYGTFYGNNGGYVDLVGQVTYLRNKYNARSNESVHQNGWGAALSAEAGKSFIVYGNNWFVEPQAQLVYQYLSLDDFNDRYRHIDQHNPSALRGRMGMRFGYNGNATDNLPPSSFYGIANIWHDFVNPKSVDIGRDTLKEEYAKTWGEIGAGIQWPITRQSDFYGDVRYEKNFGSDKRKGFKGTLGYKYTWL
ncbi:hypothetical protein BHC46_10655 [Snodgrassella alvi]|uniref:Autotransporter domain-containing protein n=1 Tax=Snodgrassella alvi TaxID=1196083 RepID=A0A2N9XCJ9_9NEIS|nr:autotransporter outer membrane beta-barrel domain-containing protein [Snodgrassella alvi]PIT44372.1 hypothetical protein BHC46_10655 [Snodgrassella alvi]